MISDLKVIANLKSLIPLPISDLHAMRRVISQFFPDHSDDKQPDGDDMVTFHNCMRIVHEKHKSDNVNSFDIEDTDAVNVRLTERSLVMDYIGNRKKQHFWEIGPLGLLLRGPKKWKIPLDDIFAVGRVNDDAIRLCWLSRASTITSPFASRKGYSKRPAVESHGASTVSQLTLLCNSNSQREQWLEWIRQKTIFWTEDNPAKMMIVVNPRSGVKKGKYMLQEKCKPLLELAKEVMPDLLCDWTVHETKSAGHATRLMIGTHRPREANCVVACGGDGILHEIVVGMLQSEDHEKLFQNLTLALVPTGTSNALCKSLMDSCDCQRSMALAIKGYSQPLDIISTFIDGKRDAIVIASHYGLFANISKLSDEYRSLSKFGIGYARYFVAAVKAINKKKYFMAKLQHVKANQETLEEIEELLENAQRREMKVRGPNGRALVGPPCPLLDKYFPGYRQGDTAADEHALENNAQSGNIETVEGRFLLAMALNTPHIDSSLSIDRSRNESMPSCGTVNLSFIRDELSRHEIYYGLYRSSRKRELSWKDLCVEHRKALAFKFTPMGAGSHRRHLAKKPTLYANNDGESVDTSRPMYGEVHPQLSRIITLPYKSRRRASALA